MKKAIGKNTIGDRDKMNVDLRTYNRSTHDLSYIWRNTQSVGTLVPFMNEVGLPGDTWELELNANVMTHPTVGPLFGTFDLQNHVYTVPFRLYNSWLHNNRAKIGLNMSQIKLPQLEVAINGTTDKPTDKNEWSQINPSCVLAYLGLRGFANRLAGSGQINVTKNAVPLLGYYDIVKNYYANLQEERFYTIAGRKEIDSISIGTTTITNWNQMNITVTDGTIVLIGKATIANRRDYEVQVRVPSILSTQRVNLDDISSKCVEIGNVLQYTLDKSLFPDPSQDLIFYSLYSVAKTQLAPWNINQIDDMRDIILGTKGNVALKINSSGTVPAVYKQFTNRLVGSNKLNTTGSQFGLALRTYQSDLYQNWVNTDWIDGAGGINEISAVDVTEGVLKMDALNLAKKVYDMLNRIAVSGGTYKDWLETVYTGDYIERTETPIFEGGTSQTISFQEVISNAATENEPLGSLAGRGNLVGKQKGGTIKIKVQEPSYIMGICSIVPRIDYSQGNRFDTNFTTIDDLHKPQLDGIGYQDLITEGMAWWSTTATAEGLKRKSAGKTVAWIEYMTNHNKTFGNFAINDNEAFMVLNRNYSGAGGETGITDLTTYIDPSKFNYIFADTSLDAMNFWIQIGVSAKVRRVMSAKQIPNL